MADYIYMTRKIIILIIYTFFSVNSMTTNIIFVKKDNTVIVLVCGYQSPSFKTGNNITILQKFQLSTVNTDMTLIGIY